jgi:hypothetical protein
LEHFVTGESLGLPSLHTEGRSAIAFFGSRRLREIRPGDVKRYAASVHLLSDDLPDPAFLDELLPLDGGGSEVAARPAEMGRNAAVDEGAA